MKTTTFVCPKCGASYTPTNNEYVTVATVAGKDSGLGRVMLPLSDGKVQSGNHACAENGRTITRNKADERLAALKAAGVDTSNMLAAQGASGEGILLRLKDGVLTPIADDDPVFEKISKSGYIPAHRLYRRWVAGQMMRMLSKEDKRGRKLSFHEVLMSKGYKYQWTTLVDEAHRLSKLQQYDVESYKEEARFFPMSVFIDCTRHYIEELERELKQNELSKIRLCISDSWLENKRQHIWKLDTELRRLMGLRNDDYTSAHKILCTFHTAIKYDSMFLRMRPRSSWYEAYKGAGGYYTMKNLIMFSGFRWYSNGRRLSESLSLSSLECYTNELVKKQQVWKLLPMLEQFLDDNGIQPKVLTEAWSKKYNK